MESKLGYVVFSSEITDRSASQVRDAAAQAGFEDFVRDLSDRSAFIRATRRLVQAGLVQIDGDNILRDKIADSETEIAFQFSERHLKTLGVDYVQRHVVTFDKKTGGVFCDNEQVRDAARKLCAELKGVCTATDINALTKRVVEKKCKRVALRDAVYLIPVQHKDMLEALQDFYKALGFHLTVLPIGVQDGQRDNLIKATLKDLRDNIKHVTEEIAGLKQEDKLTPRIARNRIKDLKRELEQYQELAASLQADVQDLFSQAGDAALALVQAVMPVDSLIAAVQQGGKLSPLILDLFQADEDMKPAVEALQAASAMQDIDLPVKNSKVIFEGDEKMHAMNVDLIGSSALPREG